MPRLSSDSPISPPRRAVRVVALVALVLAAHGALLGWVAPAWFDNETAPSIAPVLHVRSVSRHAALPLPAAARPEPAPPAAPSSSRRAGAVPVAPVVTRAAPEVPASAPESVGDTAAAPAGGAALVTEAVSDASPARVQDVPVYAPRLPPAGQWRYRLQRGAVSADATLTWTPQAEGRYEARLEAQVVGVTMLDWVSRGTIEPAGIAPERFALRRRGRDQQAANFQRDAGKITFSGPTHELPLLPGAQDRLSWLLQLPGIVDAEPSRYGAGAQVALMVVGARGGGDVWTFVVQGVETLGGRPLLKLVREARRTYDTRAEVWLDPAQAHLPVRAVLAQLEGGAAMILEREP